MALRLAALSVPRLTLHDDDLVQVENLAGKGYWPENLRRAKVSATATLCRRIHPAIQAEAVPDRFKRSTAHQLAMEGDLAIFCSVEDARAVAAGTASYFFDGGIHTEVVRVLAGSLPPSTTTTGARCSSPRRPMPARSTIYTASIAAGRMVHPFAKGLRGVPVDRDLTLNLLAAELVTGSLA